MTVFAGGAPPQKHSRVREVWALLLITVGLVTGPIGLAIGLFLVATSTRWTTPQKFLALTLPIAIVSLLMLLFGASGSYSVTCVQAGSGPEICQPPPAGHTPALLAWAISIGILAMLAIIPPHLLKAAKRK